MTTDFSQITDWQQLAQQQNTAPVQDASVGNTFNGFAGMEAPTDYIDPKYAIYPCSDYARQYIQSYDDTIGKTAQGRNGRWATPIHILAIGESFAVPYEAKIYRSLFSHVSYTAERTGKKFKVTSFKSAGVFEVARIA